MVLPAPKFAFPSPRSYPVFPVMSCIFFACPVKSCIFAKVSCISCIFENIRIYAVFVVKSCFLKFYFIFCCCLLQNSMSYNNNAGIITSNNFVYSVFSFKSLVFD